MDKDVRIAELEAENVWLRRRLAELQAKVAALSKNSRTSSKPPSSDIVKPADEPAQGGEGGKKRKPGGRRRGERPGRWPGGSGPTSPRTSGSWTMSGSSRRTTMSSVRCATR